MAQKAVATVRCSTRQACGVFSVSESCYRDQARLSSENAEIADLLVRLTHNQRNWGFGLCFLYLRNVKGYPWNHKRVVRALDQIIEWRGKPIQIRCNNGPEYISGKLMEWAEKQGVTIQHIQPGQPQQNAYIDRYNRTVRHEWLDQYIIESIEPYGGCKQSPTGQWEAQD